MVSRERDVIGYLKPHVLKRAIRAEKDGTLCIYAACARAEPGRVWGYHLINDSQSLSLVTTILISRFHFSLHELITTPRRLHMYTLHTKARLSIYTTPRVVQTSPTLTSLRGHTQVITTHE